MLQTFLQKVTYKQMWSIGRQSTLVKLRNFFPYHISHHISFVPQLPRLLKPLVNLLTKFFELVPGTGSFGSFQFLIQIPQIRTGNQEELGQLRREDFPKIVRGKVTERESEKCIIQQIFYQIRYYQTSKIKEVGIQVIESIKKCLMSWSLKCIKHLI